MADIAYEAECQRAELLGIPKPDYEEFVKNLQLTSQTEDETENEVLQDVEVSSEQMGRVSGGLDELNSILQVTQRKINRFKASCGSLTNLLKIKLGQSSVSASNESLQENNGDSGDGVVVPLEKTVSEENNERKSDLARALDNHVDKLDSLIDKAERAHISMSYQNKEMKKVL